MVHSPWLKFYIDSSLILKHKWLWTHRPCTINSIFPLILYWPQMAMDHGPSTMDDDHKWLWTMDHRPWT